MNAVRAGVAMAALVLGAGCGDERVAPVYVGSVAQSDAVIAAVTDGDEVAVYLCGGPETFDTYTRWFKGTVDARGAFSIKKDGFVAAGDLTAGTGTVTTADGTKLSWSMRPTEGAVEGLYATVDSGCRTGAVAADFDGDGVIEVQGAWCDAESRFAQVTPIMPIAVTDRGLALSVLIAPVKGLWVDRVRLP